MPPRPRASTCGFISSPWSETPDKDPSFAYPEPFKTNYIAWADAIGKLSIDHPAITGWVMDDFYINATQPSRFSDGYVTRMVEAGKAQNPDLKFFPVVYFQQPWADFVARFGRQIDGVIACYPRSHEEVDEVPITSMAMRMARACWQASLERQK